MLMSPMGLRPEKGCAGDAQQQLKNYRPDFSSERAPQIYKVRNCLKKIIKERRKIGRGSKMGAWQQDRLADWPLVVI
jgi:hypothetical protein